MAKFFNAKNLHSLPDGGLDETDEHHRSFKLLVTGNSRLFYSQWEKPKHMLKESQKRQPKLTPLGSVEDFAYSAALAAHLKLQDDIKQGIYPEATKGVGRRKTGPTFETYGTKVVAGWAEKRKNAKDAAGMKRIIRSIARRSTTCRLGKSARPRCSTSCVRSWTPSRRWPRKCVRWLPAS
jgi:hypothetical protein